MMSPGGAVVGLFGGLVLVLVLVGGGGCPFENEVRIFNHFIYI